MKDITLLLEDMKAYAAENWIPIVKGNAEKLLLEFLAAEKPQRILEIGGAIGYSAIKMCSVLASTKITSLEIDPVRFEEAVKNIAAVEAGARIELINIDAMVFLKNNNDKFDFIFLDGPKGQYYKYLPYIIDSLESGGVMWADNIHFGGRVLDYSKNPHKHRTIVNNLRRFLEMIKHDDRLETKITDEGDGIAFCRRR